MAAELSQYYVGLYTDEESAVWIREGTGFQDRACAVQLFVDLLSCDTYEEEWTQVIHDYNTKEKEDCNHKKSKKKREQKKKRKNTMKP